MKKKYLHLYLNFIFIVLAIAGISNIKFRDETFIEFIQNILLIIIIYLHFKNRKLFLKYLNKYLFYFRSSIFLLALYEEMSYISIPIQQQIGILHQKKEFNLHEMRIFDQVLINNLNLPILNYDVDITLKTFLVIVGTLVLGFGLYFPFFKKARYFFLEKDYSPYSLIYIIYVIFDSLNKNLFDSYLSMNYEFCELFIYNVLTVDVLDKILKMKKLTTKF